MELRRVFYRHLTFFVQNGGFNKLLNFDQSGISMVKGEKHV